MERDGVRALLLTQVSDERWATGFDGVFEDDPGVACLIGPSTAEVYADSRYVEAARSAAVGTSWSVREAAEPAAAGVEAAAGRGGTLALQPRLPWERYTRLADAFGGEVVPATGWLETARMVKDADEIARIEAAQEITDAAFEHVVRSIAPGVSEADLALEIEIFMRRSGAEGVAFPTIVASGPNSSKPHAGVTARLLADGDLVKMDFGALVGGYRADMTRTVVLGAASARQRAMHDAVREANEAAIAACRAGVTGPQLHGVAVEVLERHGMADRFGHGLGHGVGLDVHEGPSIGPRSKDVLAAGMVVTIEPGVYEPGFGGVRIEDLVVVEEGGCRVLTRSTKALIEIAGR